MMMWWNNGFGFGWGGWLVMTLSMVAFWGLVVFGVLALFRSQSGVSAPPNVSANRDAVQILDERLARGEIDAQEYRARQEALRSAK